MTIPAGADVRRLLDEAGNRLTDEAGNLLVDSWYLRPTETRVLILEEEARELRAWAAQPETESVHG